MNHSDVAQVSCTTLVKCILSQESQALKKTETKDTYKENKNALNKKKSSERNLKPKNI